MQIDIDDAKISKFTSPAKEELKKCINEFSGDLIRKPLNLSLPFVAGGDGVTKDRVSDAKTIVRKYQSQ